MLVAKTLTPERKEMNSMSSLRSRQVADVLDRLFTAAEQEDPPRFERIQKELAERGEPLDENRSSDLFAEVFMPVDRPSGRFLYCLARAQRPRLIVEFGMSFGISTIHLAAAVRDAGQGRVITTEMEPLKVQRAREHLLAAGLLDHVEIREGDALETLKDLPAPVDMVFLDGWKKLYLPVLRLLESKLGPGAVVAGDDLDQFPEELRGYLEHVRDPANDYVSQQIPLGDGLELSIRA
jgi:predicted O-methyltransferase YrrM